MSYVNTGAFDANGKRFASKTALKKALAADPKGIEFDPTSLFGSGASYEFIGGALINGGSDDTYGVTLVVVGPDPYTSRKWYATVEVNKAGKLTVK